MEIPGEETISIGINTYSSSKAHSLKAILCTVKLKMSTSSQSLRDEVRLHLNIQQPCTRRRRLHILQASCTPTHWEANLTLPGLFFRGYLRVKSQNMYPQKLAALLVLSKRTVKSPKNEICYRSTLACIYISAGALPRAFLY